MLVFTPTGLTLEEITILYHPSPPSISADMGFLLSSLRVDVCCLSRLLPKTIIFSILYCIRCPAYKKYYPGYTLHSPFRRFRKRPCPKCLVRHRVCVPAFPPHNTCNLINLLQYPPHWHHSIDQNNFRRQSKKYSRKSTKRVPALHSSNRR